LNINNDSEILGLVEKVLITKPNKKSPIPNVSYTFKSVKITITQENTSIIAYAFFATNASNGLSTYFRLS
jgi:hypothetical protein